MLGSVLKELGPVKIGIISAVLLAFVFGGALIFWKVSTPTYTPLFTKLTLEDSAEVIEKLESMSVPYEMRANGSVILVPNDRVLRLRMDLAKQGVPKIGSAVGYEIFDEADTLGTSNFMYNIKLRRALEGELARTIGAFEVIENARVHLNVPKQELFSKEAQLTTASVVLKIRGGQELGKPQISAISHLLATAVPGLKPEQVTIVDTQGKPLLLGGGDENDPGYFASTTEQYRREYEKKLENTISEMLSKIVGDNRIIAQVSVEMDFDRVVTNSETYDPDGQVMRSVQTIEEKESAKDGAKDNVSVSNNLPNATTSSENGGRTEDKVRTDETRNFEISKTVKNHIKETGTVKRLSVAVLVDGIYTNNPDTGEVTYAPRTEEELDRFRELVSSAIGFDSARGDKIKIDNLRFQEGIEGKAKEGKYDWLKRELGSVLQTFIIGIVVVLVIVLIIRPMVNRAFEITKAESEEAVLADLFNGPDALEALTGIKADEDEENLLGEIERVEAKVKTGAVRNLNDAIDKHAQEAITILRHWMNTETEK